MNTGQDILHNIISHAIKPFPAYNAEPLIISIAKNEKQISRKGILNEIYPVQSQNHIQNIHKLNLGNDILILSGLIPDIPVTSNLILESQDNLVSLSKAEYAHIQYYKYQVFAHYLKIILKGYQTFIPFQLEFLKISPQY